MLRRLIVKRLEVCPYIWNRHSIRRKLVKRIMLLVCLVMAAIPLLSQESYHLIKKIPIPGQGGFDYLFIDESARRLYVSHGTQVEVLDVDSGNLVGKVPNTLGVHGIAIAPELGRGFVSDGQASTVTIFDLKTLKTIGEVPTGKK